MPNISSRNTCLVLSFRKLTWRNWDPVTGCITQPKWLNNRLCQSLTMTELEQGFLGSLSPQGFWRTQLRKEVYFHCHLKLHSFAFSGRMGPHENNDATKRGVKRCKASLKWNLGALQWDELSGDHPCRVLKKPVLRKEKHLQMAARLLPSSTASLTLVGSVTIR